MTRLKNEESEKKDSYDLLMTEHTKYMLMLTNTHTCTRAYTVLFGTKIQILLSNVL